MLDRLPIDVLVAGQGAAGYTAALYAARYQLEVMVVGDRVGGETALAGRVENYPGVPAITGMDLMAQFRAQVDAHRVPVVDAVVMSLRGEAGCFTAELSDGTRVQAGAVVLAVGRERRQLGLPHEAAWLGRGISLCSTCDAPLFRGKQVAVVGGGNAAVEGALLNAHHAAAVFLIYRGDQLWRPDPILLELLGQSSVEVLMRTEVTALLGSPARGLTGIRLSRPHAGQAALSLDGLFIEIGADPRTTLAQQVDVALDPETGEIAVDRLMRTNVAGLFAAGDVTNASGPLKQTVTAAAQGALAAFSAYHYLAESPQRRRTHERSFSLDPLRSTGGR